MIGFKSTGIAAALVISLSAVPGAVKAADLPGGYTCEDLRTKAAEYGVKVLLASARSRGISEAVIASIRGKCRV